MQHIPAPHSRAPVLPGIAYPHHTITMSAPTGVHVCVEGVPFQYQLTEDDLMKVFSRYGAVNNITVMDEGGSAVVQYSLAADAARAQSFLDGKVLNGVHGALRVTLFPSVPSGRPAYEPAIPHSVGTVQKKYTCRFEIPSDIESDFAISRRIIGQKGANMKKIVSSLNSADAAKLRLRGRGSGFLEGPLKQESNEVLHLCVSCRDAESYHIVIGEVTNLLEEVYRQYAEWCNERGLVRSAPRVVPKEHPSDMYAPQALYPPSWDQWKPQGAFGRSPSPMSYSTHAGNSATQTPPDLMSPSGSRCPVDVPAIERLIEERNEARRVCNFKEADRIRDVLRAHGVGLMDEPGARGKGREVTSWRFGVKN